MAHRHQVLRTALLAATLLAGVPAAIAQPIKIGVMGDQSGPYADNGGPGSVVAATMAIEDFGKQVLGRPIELLIGDDQNKPDVGLAMARKWLSEDKVDAILTYTISPIALGVQPLMTEAKKPHLIAGTGSADLTGKACSPMAINFVYDTYALPKAVARSLVAATTEPGPPLSAYGPDWSPMTPILMGWAMAAGTPASKVAASSAVRKTWWRWAMCRSPRHSDWRNAVDWQPLSHILRPGRRAVRARQQIHTRDIAPTSIGSGSGLAGSASAIDGMVAR